MPTTNLQLLLAGVPYDVQVEPFTFNTETRFNVSFNGSQNYVFAWDSDLSLFAAIGTDGADVPDDLEDAISRHLLTLIRQSQP